MDRDLVYSEEPAVVHLTVVRDPRDEQIDELERRLTHLEIERQALSEIDLQPDPLSCGVAEAERRFRRDESDA